MIEKLKELSRKELTEKWEKLFKSIPPQHFKKELLIKHISWETQAKIEGGYSIQIKRKLIKLSEDLIKNKAGKDQSTKIIKESLPLEIKAGTRLIREYKGVRYEVIALDKGFKYRDKTYKSLSAIANEITGSRWNGKIFFGVKK